MSILTFSHRHLRTCLVVSFVALSGCSQGSAEPSSENVLPGGLSLTTCDADHLAGEFSAQQTTLRFNFSRRDGVLRASLSKEDGTALLDSELSDGIETLRVFGGKLVVSGPPSSLEPAHQGDLALLEQMGREPEMQLLTPLQDALEDAGLDAALFRAPKETPALKTAAYVGSDGYWRLAPGESKSFPTWAFWSSTYVRIKNYSSVCATVTFKVGFAIETNVVGAYGYRGFSRQWAGVPVTVQSLNAWVNWGNGQVCGPAWIGAMTQ